jgi:transcriptional regulator with XRE-family HTH domain
LVYGFKVLKLARKIRGLSLVEVAQYYGICLKTYQRWEAGKTPVAYDDLKVISSDVFKLKMADVERMAELAKHGENTDAAA